MTRSLSSIARPGSLSHAFLASAAAALFVAGPAAAGEQAGAPSRLLRIWAVMASSQPERAGATDLKSQPELRRIRGELRRLPFKSYKLLTTMTHDLSSDSRCAVPLPDTTYSFHVRARERDSSSVSLRLVIHGGSSRPYVSTDVRVRENSVVIVGGPRTAEGTLIFGVSPERDPASAATPSVPAASEVERVSGAR